MSSLPHSAFGAKPITVIDHQFIIASTKWGDFHKCLEPTYVGRTVYFILYALWLPGAQGRQLSLTGWPSANTFCNS